MTVLMVTYLAESNKKGFFNLPDDNKEEKDLLNEKVKSKGIADTIVEKLLYDLVQEKTKNNKIKEK